MQGADLLLWGGWLLYLPFTLNLLIILVGIFLILLVLIQRGKGGGLSGAFGGVGGSSAFGSRAGDQFTRVTLITAAVWILLIMFMVKIMPAKPSAPRPGQTPPPQKTQLWTPAETASASAEA